MSIYLTGYLKKKNAFTDCQLWLFNAINLN